jgi:hypothetical protein
MCMFVCVCVCVCVCFVYKKEPASEWLPTRVKVEGESPVVVKPLLRSKRSPHFKRSISLEKEKRYGRGFWQDPKPRIKVPWKDISTLPNTTNSFWTSFPWSSCVIKKMLKWFNSFGFLLCVSHKLSGTTVAEINSHCCQRLQNVFFITLYNSVLVQSLKCGFIFVLSSVRVGIAHGYGLDDRGVGVRVLWGQQFSRYYMIHTGTGVHPASYSVESSFSGGKAVGV